MSSSARLFRGVILSLGAGRLLRWRIVPVVAFAAAVVVVVIEVPTMDFRRGIFEGEGGGIGIAGNGAVTAAAFIEDLLRFGGIVWGFLSTECNRRRDAEGALGISTFNEHGFICVNLPIYQFRLNTLTNQNSRNMRFGAPI